jgi:hypothetical protein
MFQPTGHGAIATAENGQHFENDIAMTDKPEHNDKPGEYFGNRKEALEWLNANGYKVSQGKFYQDCKNNGYPFVNKDGRVSKYQVAEYGMSLQKELVPDFSALERSEHLHRKEKADAEIAEMKAERMRREEDSLWLHADTAWSTLAAVVGNLRDAIRRSLHGAQVEIVLAAGGELSRAPEVYEHIEGVVNQAFNEVAKKGFEVQWEGEE